MAIIDVACKEAQDSACAKDAVLPFVDSIDGKPGQAVDRSVSGRLSGFSSVAEMLEGFKLYGEEQKQVGKVEHDVKLQDCPSEHPADVKRYLEAHGLPATNDGGGRDEFLKGVARNTVVESMKQNGSLSADARPTDAELGKAIIDSTFAETVRQIGLDRLAAQLGVEGKPLPEVKAAMSRAIYRQSEAQLPGSSVSDEAGLARNVQELGLRNLKSGMGLSG